MIISDLFEGKGTKEEAGYIPRPKNGEKCINCTMWRDPNKCSAVAGDISPNGWCEWYAGGAYGKRGKRVNEAEGLGLTIFDIDETLMRTTAKIKVVKDGKVIRSLTNQEFNNYKLQPGEQFDFGEFRNAEKFRKESQPIAPMIAKLKAILRNAGDSKVIMLTARADFDDKETFLNTFRDLGIDMSRVHVHRAGNLPGNPAENKAVWIRKYLDTGKYSRVRLYDDSMGNIRMFNALAKEYPNVKFFPYLVTHDGGVKTVREARSFSPQVTPLQSLINEYLFFSSFGTMEAPGDAKSPDSEAKLNDVITRLAQSNKSLQNLDKQKLEANRDKILNHIHDMMKYAIAHLREHLPPEKFDEKKNQINSVLTKYNAAASTKENFSESKLNYITPNFEQEWEEAERYPEFRKIGKNAWIKLAGKGKSVTIRSAKDINNTDAADPNSFKLLDKWKQSRALDQLKSGIVEMPIIALYPDGYKELIGGNTRLTAMMTQNGEAKVWIFKVPDEVAELAEQLKEDGRIVKGVNTTVDVGHDEIKTQAAKFGNTVDRDGRPPTINKVVKGSSTNVLYNLGLAEDKEPRYTAKEWAIIEGGHTLEAKQPKKPGDLFNSLEEAWSEKYKKSINCNSPKGFSQRAHCAGRKKNEAVEPDEPGYQHDVLTMPNNTLVIDTPGELDWYKIGQHFPTLGREDPHEYGQSESDMVITFTSTEEMVNFIKIAKKLGLTIKSIGGSQEHPEIHSENFADGKNPGRKGLAKRMGVNTKASVSSLRKTAKNSSGEKARMAHWLANMKSGQKKK